MNVLIVEDNPTSRKLLHAMLECEGMTVHAATNGIEALEKLETTPVDAVISDLMMPRMDGYRLCQRVRTSERFFDLPFIVYANFLTTADRNLALDLGADQFIPKPAEVGVLVGALSDLTAGGRARRARPNKPAPEAAEMRAYGERLISKLEETNIGLEERVRVAAQMRAYGERLICKLEETNNDLEGRVRLATVVAEIGSMLGHAKELRAALQESVEILARDVNLAFVRIWSRDEASNELELAATVGEDAREEGLQARAADERNKAGQIAQQGKPYWSDDVPHNPEVADSEWADRQGVISFAGYPLVTAGRVLGVLAAFSRWTFGSRHHEMFEFLATQFAEFMLRLHREEQLLSASRSTREALEKMDTVLTASGSGIWTWDAALDVVDLDNETHRIFGQSPGGIGKSLHDFTELIHPEDRDAVARLVKGCSPGHPAYSVEFRVVWADGSTHYVESRGKGFFNDAGRLVRLTGLIHEATAPRPLAELHS